MSYNFDVSPKTIRDIWSHRTWQRATCHLWESSNVRDDDRRNHLGDRAVLKVRYPNLEVRIMPSNGALERLVELELILYSRDFET